MISGANINFYTYIKRNYSFSIVRPRGGPEKQKTIIADRLNPIYSF